MRDQLDLAAWQRDFVAALDRPQAGALAIYRNTVLLGAVDALGDNFPVCRRLLGEEAFGALAADHAAAHPPRQAALVHYGADFAAWLDAHPIAEDLPYLADVARCERMWVEALHAADAPTLDPADLLSLAPEALLAARLKQHPALRVAWLETPAMPIWFAHQQTDCPDCAPDWAGFGALFTRPGFDVTGHPLDRGTTAFITALSAGHTVGAAAEFATLRDPASDLSAAMSLALTSGAFAALHS